MTSKRGPVGAAVAGSAGLVALGYGLTLRFSIENTEEALAAEARGGWWLLVAALLLLAAAAAARWSGAPWWTAALIVVPVFLGVLPALLLPGDIVPFGTALLSAPFAVAGMAATGRPAPPG
jgi:hypothetical protein